VGFRGFFGGPTVHVIDSYALADPLLARIPARYTPDWRIGHFTRIIPAGYPQSAASGNNQLQDVDLAVYYDALTRVIRGPLWSRERWKTIVAMNLGHYDHLIDARAYRYPNLPRVTLGDRSAGR
jgi:arabinofuranosyltransferase